MNESKQEFKAVMNRIIVKRRPDAIPLFYDGQEIEIKEGKIFKKGSVISMPVTEEMVRVQNRELEGEIVKMGPFASLERFGVEVKEGDIIRYSAYAAGITRLNGEKFDVINDAEIFAVVVPAEAK